jgi:hypothetical protein
MTITSTLELKSLARHGSTVARWTTADLNRYCGGPASGRDALGNPSKMPGKSYGIPAAACITGTKLRDKPGSVCAPDPASGYEGCYAFERGRYAFANVLECQYRRLESISRPLWPAAMAELIRRTAKPDPVDGVTYVRLHDSGDLQSLEHLAAICRIARLSPQARFWLPTREYRIVATYRRSGRKIPGNLKIRMSAHMLGGKAPKFSKPLVVSTVSTAPGQHPNAHHCPAPNQGNECGDCRACWYVDWVTYHAH